MDLKQSVETGTLNKSTYINLRWIGILGQIITINSVKFVFGFEFNFILSNLIIFIGALSNLYLMFFYRFSIWYFQFSVLCLIKDIFAPEANIIKYDLKRTVDLYKGSTNKNIEK